MKFSTTVSDAFDRFKQVPESNDKGGALRHGAGLRRV